MCGHPAATRGTAFGREAGQTMKGTANEQHSKNTRGCRPCRTRIHRSGCVCGTGDSGSDRWNGTARRNGDNGGSGWKSYGERFEFGSARSYWRRRCQRRRGGCGRRNCDHRGELWGLGRTCRGCGRRNRHERPEGLTWNQPWSPLRSAARPTVNGVGRSATQTKTRRSGPRSVRCTGAGKLAIGARSQRGFGRISASADGFTLLRSHGDETRTRVEAGGCRLQCSPRGPHVDTALQEEAVDR